MLRWLCLSALALGGCTVGGGTGSARDFGGVAGDASMDGGAGDLPPGDGAAPSDLTPPPDLGGQLTTLIGVPTGMSTINLASEGSVDWVHWGRVFETSVDRKAGVTPLISSVTPIGTGELHQYTDNHITWQWSGGAPTANEPGSTTGIFIYGVGNGFMLSAPASPTLRTLSVYLGSFVSDFKVTAHISDGTALDFSETVVNPNPIDDPRIYRRYTFSYKSLTPNQTFEVSWTNIKDHYGGANVSLQSATLQ
jgi:hypothetical protein